jgi:hypothetical protein
VNARNADKQISVRPKDMPALTHVEKIAVATALVIVLVLCVLFHRRITDAEHRMANAEHRVTAAERRAANAEHRMTSAERRLVDAERRLTNTGRLSAPDADKRQFGFLHFQPV